MRAGRPVLGCVGDLMVDVRVRAPALARGGDVPGSVTLTPGGAGANVAVWARAAGAEARAVGCVGDDLAGGLLVAALGKRGVALAPAPGTSRSTQPAGTATPATGAMLVVWEAGERTFVADPGANPALAVADVEAALHDLDGVYVSGYSLIRPGSRPAATAALAHGLPGAVDAASWPLLEGAAGRAVLDASRRVGTLLANADEAAVLTGLADPERSAAALARRTGLAVVKRGAQGALVALAERVVAVPAVPADAVDATGAGDAFAAGFLVARLGGADPVEAAGLAVSLAARAVAVEGAWPPAT